MIEEYVYDGVITEVAPGSQGWALLKGLSPTFGSVVHLKVIWRFDKSLTLESFEYIFDGKAKMYIFSTPKVLSHVMVTEGNPKLKQIWSTPTSEVGPLNWLGFILPPTKSKVFLSRPGSLKTIVESSIKSSQTKNSNQITFKLCEGTPLLKGTMRKDYSQIEASDGAARQVSVVSNLGSDGIPISLEYSESIREKLCYTAKFTLLRKQSKETVLKLEDVADKSFVQDIGSSGTYFGTTYNPNLKDYDRFFKTQSSRFDLAQKVKTQPNLLVGIGVLVFLVAVFAVWRFVIGRKRK